MTTQLTLVQRKDGFYHPTSEDHLTILMHITNGLAAVNDYGLESLVYPNAAIHQIMVTVLSLADMSTKDIAEDSLAVTPLAEPLLVDTSAE